MSDFDKFFAEKLDEEGQFPRQDKNWQAISGRLDAFDAGASITTSHLRYWQIATIAAIAVVGILTWNTVRVCAKNDELRQKVAVLQAEIKSAKQDAAQESAHLAEEKPQVPIVGEKNGRSSTADAATGVPFVLNKERYKAKNPVRNPKSDSQNIAAITGSLPQKGASEGSNPIVADEKKNLADVPNTPDSVGALKTDVADLKKMPALSLLSADALENVTLSSEDKIAPLLLQFQQPEDAAATVESKTIKPFRPLSRFRVGAQVLTGTAQPGKEGVSRISGQGLTAEFALWGGLSLMASADWLRFEVSTDEFHPQFHPNNLEKKAPPPPWFYKLSKVESDQRQRQYGLGVKYALPVRFWLRPSVRVAHTWAHVSPSLVSYKYQKKFPPPPNFPNFPWYNVKHYESKRLEDIWRFGAGLEFETRRWAFGLWADYYDNFAATNATFDALLFRASAQYKLRN